MAYVNSNGVNLYAESTGVGAPIVFVHEFAGDHRSWENQVRFFSRRFRCITYNARGYPPSDVPESVGDYSQHIAVEDLVAVLRHFGLSSAHIVGLSIGGYATLHFGLTYPEMAKSLVIAATGVGSDAGTRDQFLADGAELADRLVTLGMREGIEHYVDSDIRRRLKVKNPRGFEEFKRQFEEHSAIGSSLTTRGIQLTRPTIYSLEERMSRLDVPSLIVTGDSDEACLGPALSMKRNIPNARLWVVPDTTHAVNIEEPESFNRVVYDFISEIECTRDQ